MSIKYLLKSALVSFVVVIMAHNVYSLDGNIGENVDGKSMLGKPILDSGEDAQRCVEYSQLISVPNKKLGLEMSSDQRSASTSKQITGRVSAKVDLLVASAKASLELSSRNVSSERSWTNTIAIDYDMGTLRGLGPTLTTWGESLKGTDGFDDYCGSSYISAVDRSNRILLTASLNFSSEELFKQFKGSVDIKIGFIKKKKEIEKVLEDKKYENTVMTIKVHTEGELLFDMQNEFGKLLCDINSPECRSANGKQVMAYCSGVSEHFIGDCLDLYQRISKRFFSSDNNLFDGVGEISRFYESSYGEILAADVVSEHLTLYQLLVINELNSIQRRLYQKKENIVVGYYADLSGSNLTDIRCRIKQIDNYITDEGGVNDVLSICSSYQKNYTCKIMFENLNNNLRSDDSWTCSN